MTEETSSAAFETARGEQIAGYQIEAEIGRGGMAIVYRARDVKLGRPVALKILAPRLAQDESFRRRFIHESRAAAAVDHPHIVPVFEAGESGGFLFIAMRYVGTGDVRTLLERHGRLPVGRAVAIASQVASALDAAHARGLVHRDIKPANMLLAESADGRADHVYLSDFGLSKQSLAPAGLTSTGQFLGTLDYVAPEQIEGRPVDGRADLYALACATVEMLTGAPPFRRAENLALMWAQLSEPPPLPTERCPDLPPSIDQVVGRALAKSPDDRYRTCMDFAAGLRAACAAAAVPPAPPAWGSPVPPPWSSAAPLGAIPPSVPLPPAPAAWFRPDPADPLAGTAPQQPPGLPEASAGQLAPAGPPGAAGIPAAGMPPLTSHRSPPGRRGRSGLAIAAVVIVLLCVAGLGYKLLDHASAAPAAGGTVGVATPTVPRSARTVQAYFTAINHHRYGVAWILGGRDTGKSYALFVAGFHSTAHDAVRILSARGRVVTARLTATQTDGSVRTYQGTYTVRQGRITHSDIHQTS